MWVFINSGLLLRETVSLLVICAQLDFVLMTALDGQI